MQVLKIVYSSLSQSQHTHNDLWAPSDRRNSEPWESCTQVGSRGVSTYSIHQSGSQLSLSPSLNFYSCVSKFTKVSDNIYVTNISISELIIALCRPVIKFSTRYQAWFLCISHLISNKLSAGCKNSRKFSLSGAVFGSWF